MRTKLRGLKIAAIGTCLPKSTFHIASYEQQYGSDIKRIMESTGVKEVRIAEDDLCTSDYCVFAAQQLLKSLNIAANDVDGIVFVSQTPDYILPATSVIMQDRLGLPKGAVAFDINYGCSGYVYGLFQAALLVSSGSCSRVLLCAGDTQLKLVHELDKANRMVLGDGFSVTLIERGEEELCFNMKSDGSGHEHIIVPSGGFRRPHTAETCIAKPDGDGNMRSEENSYMNGFEIMSFAIREVPKLLRETLEYVGWEKESVGTFALHQANRFMLQYLSKRAKLPLENVPISIEKTGNTASASIPLMFSLEAGRLRREGKLDRVVACGFGVGLSWGAVTMNLAKTKIFEPWEM